MQCVLCVKSLVSAFDKENVLVGAFKEYCESSVLYIDVKIVAKILTPDFMVPHCYLRSATLTTRYKAPFRMVIKAFLLKQNV